MDSAALIDLAQENGIIVDKRWGEARLRAALKENGIEVPASEPEEVEAAEPVAAKPKPSSVCTAICMDDHIYIAPKDVGKFDNSLSVIYRKGDKIPFVNEGVALSLDAAGRVKLI